MRLNKRMLNALETAVSAMLAGEQGEGDWPDDLPKDDLELAHEWVCERQSVYFRGDIVE